MYEIGRGVPKITKARNMLNHPIQVPAKDLLSADQFTEKGDVSDVDHHGKGDVEPIHTELKGQCSDFYRNDGPE